MLISKSNNYNHKDALIHLNVENLSDRREMLALWLKHKDSLIYFSSTMNKVWDLEMERSTKLPQQEYWWTIPAMQTFSRESEYNVTQKNGAATKTKQYYCKQWIIATLIISLQINDLTWLDPEKWWQK